jgi:large subunit ribosomal protein L25
LRRKERDASRGSPRSFGDKKQSPQDDNQIEELNFMATAIETNLLEANPRESGNKNDARRVRQGGKIPGVVYGAGKDSLPVTVDPRHVLRILHSETGHNTIFDLTLNGGERTKAMIVDWQYEPIKGSLLHIDLKRIAMDKVLKVNVPIVLKGEAAGVKQEGGILEQILREVEIECLPADIPSHIDADVSELVFGKVLRVSDLPKLEKVKFITDANQPVAHVTTVKEEVVATPDATAVDAAAAPAEPEVIKKGKQETEEEGAEAAPAKPEKAEKKEKK